MFDLPDNEILPLSKEHVFWTWSAQSKVHPMAIKRAKGVYFWDVDDKRYLDFNSMTMCVNIGHGNERVIKAMQDQAAELPYAAPGMTTKICALASRAVAEITAQGALTKVLFTLGGADANENDIKLARGYTKRHKILYGSPATSCFPLDGTLLRPAAPFTARLTNKDGSQAGITVCLTRSSGTGTSVGACFRHACCYCLSTITASLI